MSEYQEEVLTNLLSLQAELRGDEPEPPGSSSTEAASQEADASAGEDTVAVTEEGVTVSLSSGEATSTGVNERLAALNDRLAQLEHELRSVTRRIERMEPDLDIAGLGEKDGDVDARWRSFLDLQRIVAERLDQS
jgi:hypothetical protein